MCQPEKDAEKEQTSVLKKEKNLTNYKELNEYYTKECRRK